MNEAQVLTVGFEASNELSLERVHNRIDKLTLTRQFQIQLPTRVQSFAAGSTSWDPGG
ncbi:hypothetical protein TSUD_111680 [Trifolium subterraneum]|uniref:Uncharacterized protein n=1 Tax=Trifolium subterraneum TaxID=3900 RepID=A0A2Z6LVJ5_TRISU|nr:hypothetical protein TSUD_111680 [Trifolium subterraneum]